MSYTLEVCVDSTASALAAKEGGANRLELCADLIVGGTTPSLALVRQVKETTGLPVRALLRPRFGDFCYDRWELAQMAASAAELVAARFLGVRALADQQGHHPKRPHRSGYTVTKRSRHWMWRDRFVYLSCFKASLTST